MLSANAYSFRQKSRLAISLSWVGGYTNVITFIVCGQVTSHMTGNATHLGLCLGDGDGQWAWYFAFLLGSFLAGAISSAFMTEGARRLGMRSKYILPLAVEGVLLCALSLCLQLWRVDAGHPMIGGFSAALFAVTGIASFAMGLQNATITKISGAVVRTTHLTGVITDLGLEGVQYLLWVWDKTRNRRWERAGRVLRLSQRHPGVLRLALLASIFGSFLFGVVAGTLTFTRWPGFALLAPIAFLLWIVLLDRRKPIADVRELDLLADAELAAFGNIKSFLPPELGIYRLSHHRRDALHHAPDFQAWVERLPRQWRVVILAVSPMTHFDTDAGLDLLAAVQRLRQQRRDIVVCGVNRPQYKALTLSGLTDVLGGENLCSDMEFAIARGMNRIQELDGANRN